MTLTQIKAMFQVGSVWSVTRHSPNALIVGNMGNTSAEAHIKIELRTVVKAKSELVCSRENLPCIFTKWPKASEVIEASEVHLKFQYEKEGTLEGVTCTFNLVS